MEREQTTIRLPTDLKEQIQREADARGMPMKDLIMIILWNYFQTSLSYCTHDRQHQQTNFPELLDQDQVQDFETG